MAIGLDVGTKQLTTILQRQFTNNINKDQTKNTALIFSIDSNELAKIYQKLIDIYILEPE